MDFKLLTRDQFRKTCLKRDKESCLVCGAKENLSVHHIIERRLFNEEQEKGGYFLENGATLCETHHRLAESTELSCDEIRRLVGIVKFPIPSHLYRDQPYDKWGNPILPNNLRLRGELFEDVSVQKVLTPVLYLFTDRVKYPRTYHLPWSPGVTSDDRVLSDLSEFENASEVIVTVKQDGENSTLYNDYLHARSIEYESHPSRSWLKALHARIANNIPKGWRVCGENLYAVHSIKYQNLEDYFQVFSVWNDKNVCLSWEETKVWTALLELATVPVLYQGPWDKKLIQKLPIESFNNDPCEGYVVRVSEPFHYKEFRKKVGKMVRANHVQTHGHWMRSKLELNKVIK